MEEWFDAGEHRMILAVGFGADNMESYERTIGAVEKDVARAFPAWKVRLAFSNRTVLERLKAHCKVEADCLEEALRKAAAEGITELAVQPVYLVKGTEYEKLAAVLGQYRDRFAKVALGEPLLSGTEDFEAVARAVTGKMSVFDKGETAICFMGHGTQGEANCAYSMLQEKLRRAGYGNYYIGVMEGEPGLGRILDVMGKKGIYRKAVLAPLMLSAGKHARREMAGGQEGSWRLALHNAGYEVECVLEGLGEIPAVREIYVKHVRKAVLHRV